MTTVTLKGNPIHTSGQLPAVGQPAPDFTLTGVDLKELTRGDFAGRWVVLNIFPSIDTPTCAASVRRFNQEAAALTGTAVLCVECIDATFELVGSPVGRHDHGHFHEQSPENHFNTRYGRRNP